LGKGTRTLRPGAIKEEARKTEPISRTRGRDGREGVMAGFRWGEEQNRIEHGI